MRKPRGKLNAPHRRITATIAAMIVAAGTAVAGPATPAHAAITDPVAIGVTGVGTRVLEVAGDGSADGTPVQAAAYQVGIGGGPEISRQRWTLERLPYDQGGADFGYHIRHAASGKCLTKGGASDGAQVVVSTCTTTRNQVWWTSAYYPSPQGTPWLTQDDYRCLDMPADSPNASPRVQTRACSGQPNQNWQLVTGSFDCPTRDREWLRTDLCVQTSEDLTGVEASWRSREVNLDWVDPNKYTLSNTVQNYIASSRGDSGLEFGWRADRGTQPTGSTGYNLYWSEWGPGRSEYHVIPSSAAPGSDQADSRDHSYLMTTNDTGQWDLSYDFNPLPLATTTLQTSRPARAFRTGLAIRYDRAASINTPFDNRVQLLTATSDWRRATATEVTTGEPKTCDAPPSYQDWGQGSHDETGNDIYNRAPWCFTTATLVAGPQIGAATQIDGLRVGKPGKTAAAAAHVAPPATATVADDNTVDGVNQRLLATCLRTDASTCMKTVPGLSSCVKAHKICNLAAAHAHRLPSDAQPRSPMTANEAREAARKTFSSADDSNTAAATQPRLTAASPATIDAALGTRLGTELPAGEQLYLITATEHAKALAATDTHVYQGYAAVYHAATHRLLYACLGTTCPTNG